MMKSGIIFFALLLVALYSFAGDSLIFIKNIEIQGNKKTKEAIILRELLFKKGERYPLKEWPVIKEKSRENLINTSLFHSAAISLDNGGDDSVTVNIKVVERWYLWPVPQVDIQERNFNVWWQTKSFERLSAGVFLTKENFRGRMEELMLLFMVGYNKQLGVAYDAPYINKKKTFGLGAEVIWSSRHEVNSATYDDKQVYYKDEQSPVRSDLLAAIHFRYRKNYYLSHLLQLRFHKYYFADSLIEKAPLYSWKDLKELPFFGLYYKIKLDHRDYKPYPLKGYYADLEVFNDGWGLLNNSGMSLWDFKTTLRKYWTLSDRFYFAAGFIGKISNHGIAPYVLHRSLGYGRDFVRGFEYYVVDGSGYAVAKSNIKWAVVQRKSVKVNFIKTEKFNTIPYAFYLNFFADAGYVSRDALSDVSNALPGKVLYSFGLGLDFSTYYDKVMRFEVALNSLGEPGFYLHFIAPI